MMRNPNDYSCQTIHNEIFNIAPDAKNIEVLMNPRMRHKTLTCMPEGQNEKEIGGGSNQMSKN